MSAKLKRIPQNMSLEGHKYFEFSHLWTFGAFQKMSEARSRALCQDTFQAWGV
jgi:hypothetical protein